MNEEDDVNCCKDEEEEEERTVVSPVAGVERVRDHLDKFLTQRFSGTGFRRYQPLS